MQFVNKRSTKYSPGAGPAVPEKCPETGSGFQMGGPMWAGPIHDPSWIQGLLDTMEVTGIVMQAIYQYLNDV